MGGAGRGRVGQGRVVQGEDEVWGAGGQGRVGWSGGRGQGAGACVMASGLGQGRKACGWAGRGEVWQGGVRRAG